MGYGAEWGTLMADTGHQQHGVGAGSASVRWDCATGIGLAGSWPAKSDDGEAEGYGLHKIRQPV